MPLESHWDLWYWVIILLLVWSYCGRFDGGIFPNEERLLILIASVHL